MNDRIEHPSWVVGIVGPDGGLHRVHLPVDDNGVGHGTIGRSRTATIQVADFRMSRQHLTIEVHPPDGRVILKDLGSAGGFYMNGSKHPQVVWPVGETINISSQALVLHETPEFVAWRATWRLGIEVERDTTPIHRAVVDVPDSTMIVLSQILPEDVAAKLGARSLRIQAGRIVRDARATPCRWIEIDGEPALEAGDLRLHFTLAPLRTTPAGDAQMANGDEHYSPPGWILHVDRPGAKPLRLDVETHEIVAVGRDLNCAIRINDPRLQPRHLVLFVDHKGRLRTSKSTDPQSRATIVPDGEPIAVGPVQLRVRVQRAFENQPEPTLSDPR